MLTSAKLLWFLLFEFAAPTAVIKMEGGTDFDLQVLEVPTALVVGGGEGTRAGERSQDATMGGNGIAQASTEVPGSQPEEAGGHKGRDRKDSKQVSAEGGSDWTPVGHMAFPALAERRGQR